MMLFQTCTKLTFGLSDKWQKYAPKSEKVSEQLNVVAIQNSLDGFRNTLNAWNNGKTSRWFPFIRSVTSCNWFLAATEKSFCKAIRL